jgi:hypothetical protein
MESGVGRWDAGTEWKMVDKFGAEERFRDELFDFFVVFRVVGKGASAGLREARSHTERQREQNAEQAANHGPPQGNAIAGDFIDSFSKGRNPIALHVDDAGPFGL